MKDARVKIQWIPKETDLSDDAIEAVVLALPDAVQVARELPEGRCVQFNFRQKAGMISLEIFNCAVVAEPDESE